MPDLAPSIHGNSTVLTTSTSVVLCASPAGCLLAGKQLPGFVPKPQFSSLYCTPATTIHDHGSAAVPAGQFRPQSANGTRHTGWIRQGMRPLYQLGIGSLQN